MNPGQAFRLCIALCFALAAWPFLATAPASAAHVVHELEAHFDVEDIPGGPYLALGIAPDDSGGPSEGDVYVADAKEEGSVLHSFIFKFDEEGNYAKTMLDGSNVPGGSFSFIEPTHETPSLDPITVDDSGGLNHGDLYVADLEHHVIDRFDESGAYLCQITGAATPSATECAGVTGSQTPAGGFIPTGLAVDRSTGTLYVSDLEHHVIDRFDESGAFAGQISDPHLTAPGPIDLDSTGALYVVNGILFASESADKFDAAGNFVSTIDEEEPLSVAVDSSSGNVYLTDLAHREEIREFDSAGNPIATASSGEERFYAPLGVTGSTGRLYGGSLFFNLGVDAFSPDTVIPDVSTSAPTSVGETTATLNGEVDPAGGGDIVRCRFEYGTTPSYGQSAPCSPATPYASLTAVSASLSGLDFSTTYYYRLAAANAGVSPYTRGIRAKAQGVFFTTGPPTVDEESTSNVDRMSAALRAKINPHGFDTEFKFEYVDAAHFEAEGFSSAATRSTLLSELGEGLKPLSVNQGVAGLEVGTTYHFRAVAVSPRGNVMGPDQTFTTLPVATIGSPWAYAHVVSATIEGKINPLGLDTTCQVQYVSDATFERSGYADAELAPCAEDLGSGTTDTVGKAQLKGLALETTYHFRFLATNSSGTLAGPDEAFATFGLESFSVDVVDEHGNPYTQAGGHPYARIIHYTLNHTRVPSAHTLEGYDISTDGFVKDLISELPPGESPGGNEAVPECPGFLAEATNCNKSSQIGYIEVEYFTGSSIGTTTRNFFKVVPPDGVASRYASVNPYSPSDSHLRTASDYGITSKSANLEAEGRGLGVTVVIWGIPADHNGGGGSRLAILRNPTSCEGTQTARVRADSWQDPGQYATASAELPPVTGCDKLKFHPSIEWQPTSTAADSPTGLHVDVHQPQSEDPNGLAFADLRNVVLNPAKGMILNPAGVEHLVGCTPDEFAQHEETPAHCPDASKVGSAEIDTPLVNHPLLGGVYMAEAYDNPFNSMFAIYVAIDDPETGVVVKLAGEIQTGASDGQLTAKFNDNPQQPVEDFKLDFYGGPRAVLRTPPECGTFPTTSIITPWSAPQSGPPARPTDSYKITEGPNGKPCVAHESEEPDAVSLRAGPVTPSAGSYSPFVMRLDREDGTQQMAELAITPPPGLLGRIAGIPRCPEEEVEAAALQTGAEERANPSCAEATQVGTVVIGAGAGAHPYYTKGKVYLSGPYRGASVSLAIIVPVVAGPYDLGTTVIRTPLQVNLETGQIEVETDPIPTILSGVSLDIRTIAVQLDRPGFTLNPTHCASMQTVAAVMSLSGQRLDLSDPFRVDGCTKLAFRPKIGLRLLGRTHRRSHPALKAVLRMPKGNANLSRVAVSMPPTEFLDEAHIRGICTRVEFAEKACPPDSVYGWVKAWSPLLDRPLAGPVYMRSSARGLPDLVAELNGEFHLILAGRIGSAHGGVGTNVGNIPDVPVTKFQLGLFGGGKGLFHSSVDACRRPQRAVVEMEGQNKKVVIRHPLLQVNCKGRSAARVSTGREAAH